MLRELPDPKIQIFLDENDYARAGGESAPS